MTTAICFGTRPEIIKLWSFIKELEKRKEPFFLINSGQHYDENMMGTFLKSLQIPKPKYNLNINQGTDTENISRMLPLFSEIFKKEKVTTSIHHGDTSTCLASCIAARKSGVTKVVHIEAGLRSWERNLPEELHRTLVDDCCDYLFCPTKNNTENINPKNKTVTVTGNTEIDMLKHFDKNNKIKTIKEKYILMTLHRQSNVDIRLNLKIILRQVSQLSKKMNLPIKFVCHPRTEKRISEFEIKLPETIQFLPPQGLLEFLTLEKNAQLVITDSGGCIENCSYFKVPCAVIRQNTERQEAMEENTVLIDDIDTIERKVNELIKRDKKEWTGTVFGNGHAAKKICDTLYGGKK